MIPKVMVGLKIYDNFMRVFAYILHKVPNKEKYDLKKGSMNHISSMLYSVWPEFEKGIEVQPHTLYQN